MLNDKVRRSENITHKENQVVLGLLREGVTGICNTIRFEERVLGLDDQTCRETFAQRAQVARMDNIFFARTMFLTSPAVWSQHHLHSLDGLCLCCLITFTNAEISCDCLLGN
jgi:hypothetical protein